MEIYKIIKLILRNNKILFKIQRKSKNNVHRIKEIQLPKIFSFNGNKTVADLTHY